MGGGCAPDLIGGGQCRTRRRALRARRLLLRRSPARRRRALRGQSRTIASGGRSPRRCTGSCSSSSRLPWGGWGGASPIGGRLSMRRRPRRLSGERSGPPAYSMPGGRGPTTYGGQHLTPGRNGAPGWCAKSCPGATYPGGTPRKYDRPRDRHLRERSRVAAPHMVSLRGRGAVDSPTGKGRWRRCCPRTRTASRTPWLPRLRRLAPRALRLRAATHSPPSVCRSSPPGTTGE
jgi:hypothetical protein